MCSTDFVVGAAAKRTAGRFARYLVINRLKAMKYRLHATKDEEEEQGMKIYTDLTRFTVKSREKHGKVPF